MEPVAVVMVVDTVGHMGLQMLNLEQLIPVEVEVGKDILLILPEVQEVLDRLPCPQG